MPPPFLAGLANPTPGGPRGFKPPADPRAGQARTPVAAWGRFVSRNAKIILPISVLLLVLLASPVSQVRLGLADSSTAPKDQTTRKAYDLLSAPDGFGAGFTAPIPVVIDLANDHQAAAQLESAMKQVPGVKEVAAPIYNAKTPDQASVSIINAYSRFAPQDSRTDDIVSQLRDNTIPRTLDGSSAQAYVSGANAAFTDIGDIIFNRAPYFLLYIVGITFLVLAMAFRSIVIATKAAITTLASALVGFGVLTLVVQLGHGMGIIGLDRTGPIESFIPPIAFAILFGLSMDYEVFLMSRIREEHIHGENTISAVKDGMAGVGRVIFAAALIMSSVFFSFLLTPDRVSKEFGLLLGIAILTDAIIIRLTFVPALLSLLEERSWAMPAWLDKALPNLTIEPPGERQQAGDRHARGGEPAAATD
jgi:RND superfamily putative drug exporter